MLLEIRVPYVFTRIMVKRVNTGGNVSRYKIKFRGWRLKPKFKWITD